MKSLLAFLFILNSSIVFGGAHKIEEEDLPDIKLQSGQIVMLEKYLRKHDKDLKNGNYRLEFICKKKTKKNYLGNEVDCKLIKIN